MVAQKIKHALAEYWLGVLLLMVILFFGLAPFNHTGTWAEWLALVAQLNPF